MIKITPNAKQKLIDILKEGNGKERMRFGLRGGGCNGFEYYFSLDEDSPNEDDIVITLAEELYLYVDYMSMTYLENTEIDYKKDLMGESFVFNNPQQQTKCGCGNSVGF
jgi:iron-sulfur cluster assembly protein